MKLIFAFLLQICICRCVCQTELKMKSYDKNLNAIYISKALRKNKAITSKERQ